MYCQNLTQECETAHYHLRCIPPVAFVPNLMPVVKGLCCHASEIQDIAKTNFLIVGYLNDFTSYKCKIMHLIIQNKRKNLPFVAISSEFVASHGCTNLEIKQILQILLNSNE